MKHEIEKRVLEEIFASSEAHRNLLVLADDIGARLAGSENEVRARDFLLDTLSRYGLNDVHVEEFQHRAWSPVEERLAVTAPVEREIACRCGGLSPSTPVEGIETVVVFLRTGRPGGIRGSEGGRGRQSRGGALLSGRAAVENPPCRGVRRCGPD